MQYGGELDESILNLFRDFERFTKQINHNDRQKALFFINTLIDPALTLFSSNTPHQIYFKLIKQIILQEYDLKDRQREAQIRLYNLTLLSFMAETEISDDPDGVTKLCSYINGISPQCKPLIRNETYQLKVLIIAVASFEWDTIPINKEISNNFNFQSFKTAVAHSISLVKEKTKLLETTPNSSPNMTLFRQYANKPARLFNNLNNYRYRNQ